MGTQQSFYQKMVRTKEPFLSILLQHMITDSDMDTFRHIYIITEPSLSWTFNSALDLHSLVIQSVYLMGPL